MKKFLVAAGILAFSATAFAGGVDGTTITSGTQSTAQQAVGVQNSVNLGGTPDITYHGSYDVRSAPTMYAPGLTASMTETCWGSVSAAVSVVGVGVAGGATVKDLDCNRRLNASVAWKMDRKDIAFNIMCREDDFREAAALTKNPCVGDKPQQTSSVDLRTTQPTALVEQQPQYRDPLVRERMGLPPLVAGK